MELTAISCHPGKPRLPVGLPHQVQLLISCAFSSPSNKPAQSGVKLRQAAITWLRTERGPVKPAVPFFLTHMIVTFLLYFLLMVNSYHAVDISNHWVGFYFTFNKMSATLNLIFKYTRDINVVKKVGADKHIKSGQKSR